ncbi:MAG TPA: AAA family ATPase [Rickettsiales bacterium]|nr:AAA family ATPase [Rickettsiales bacterium]
MRLRTFNAPDMKVAMQMIRETLGEEAIIISSGQALGGNGIVVTAATEQPAHEASSPPVTSFLHAASFTSQAVLEQIETVLRFHSAPDYVVNRMLETARHLCLQGRDMHTDLTRLMAASFQYAPLPLEQDTYTIMLVGPPGTGKTMTIAKMASQVVMEKKKPIVITTDNKRAGGVEQLSAFTTILGIELHVADNRGELWRLLQEFAHHGRLLIDTGGVNPYNMTDLRELAEYIKLDRSIEPVLVAAAGSDSAEADDMARAFAPLGVRRLLVTRIDAARRYGSILTAAHSGRLAFSHASNSSRIIGEFVTFDPATLTELLLGYQKKDMI